MEIIIVWSANAENQLKDIYDYYSEVSGERVAKRLMNQLIERTVILEKNPKSGQKEELLKDYKEEFRYLVEGNYKILYWIEKNIITISSVFDCRQNPEKIKNF